MASAGEVCRGTAGKVCEVASMWRSEGREVWAEGQPVSLGTEAGVDGEGTAVRTQAQDPWGLRTQSSV